MHWTVPHNLHTLYFRVVLAENDGFKPAALMTGASKDGPIHTYILGSYYAKNEKSLQSLHLRLGGIVPPR